VEASIHEAASVLFEMGFISTQAMKRFDKGCQVDVDQAKTKALALKHALKVGLKSESVV